MDFCTIGDIESFLQVTIPVAQQASAQRAITEATAVIKNYCNQVIEKVEGDAIILDCGGGTRVFLPEIPVIVVTDVVEDGETLVAGADEDYQLGQYGILHRVDQDWAVGIQIVEVTYDHGYDPIPDDVVGVCTRMAARAYQAGLRAAELEAVPGVTAMSLGDYSVSFGTEAGSGGEGVLGASAAPMLLRSEEEVLAKYRVKR
jgi:hypothetical protein